MQKNLKLKLEHLSRDQLLELLEELSNVPDVQKMIKAMVAPSKGDLDRLVQQLANRCEIYMCNSCNAKDYDRMLSALTPIYGAYRFADTKIAAYIAWKTYCVSRIIRLLHQKDSGYAWDGGHNRKLEELSGTSSILRLFSN